MSHFSRIQTQFRDREILIQCLQEMGYQVIPEGLIKGYHGQEKVDFSIQAEKGYGIGFRQNAEGTYDIIADWWGVRGTRQQDLIERLQARVNRIQRDYALKVVMEQTQKMGFSVVDQIEEKNGEVRLVVRRWV
ncbi:MAG: DUF1257 domain-containing protein [Methanomicrobiales archaeon]|nr:DUF1257 domain-containing protein [Methanomicrobiales archaeon]